jgi:hypothetical protein
MLDEFIRAKNALCATYTNVHFNVPERQIWTDTSDCTWKRETSSANIAARHLLLLAYSKIIYFIFIIRNDNSFAKNALKHSREIVY